MEEGEKLKKRYSERNPMVNVSTLYDKVAEQTGLTIADVKALNDFRFQNMRLLIKALYKHRIHYRDFMNLSLNKKQIALMEDKGILERNFDEETVNRIVKAGSNNKSK